MTSSNFMWFEKGGYIQRGSNLIRDACGKNALYGARRAGLD